jgi:DNA-binding NarL/FixJ family response regulator
MDKKRVLIIEDNKKSCLLLAGFLDRRKINGHTISPECAHSFAEGRAAIRLRASQRTPFNCIVSDLCLPDSEPMDTIAQLRQLAGNVPIRALTGLSDPDIIRACRTHNIRLILKGTAVEDIMEEILYAIAETEPGREIDEAIARNKPVSREIQPEQTVTTFTQRHEMKLGWKWLVATAVTLIPIITFCFTAGASLYRGLNDKAENKVGTALAAKATKETIDFHTAQISDVQLHVRALEDNQIKQQGKLDNITSLVEKIDRNLEADRKR